jgi:hypothetical protein
MNENDVIAELKKHLQSQNYTLVSECSTTMQGKDLVMKKSNHEIWIEAKGKTSSRELSSRYGLDFNDAQCHDHFSRAFFKACEMRDETKRSGRNIRIAMAFAHTKHYQKYCDRTNDTRKELGIGLFWVKETGVVEESRTPDIGV